MTTPRLARLTNLKGAQLDFLLPEQPHFVAWKGRAFVAQWDRFPDPQLVFHYREFHRPLHQVFAALDDTMLAPPEAPPPPVPETPLVTGEEEHDA